MARSFAANIIVDFVSHTITVSVKHCSSLLCSAQLESLYHTAQEQHETWSKVTAANNTRNIMVCNMLYTGWPLYTYVRLSRHDLDLRSPQLKD